jgi:type II secretory pathway pseudopilin PulG
VELLVVIAIIAILISIMGVVLANMGQQAKEAATNATIRKIHTLLEQRLEAFDRAMNQIEKNKNNEQQYKNEWDEEVEQLSGMRPPASKEQVKILVRKRFKKLNFPQRPDDIGGTDDDEDITESSERLYEMLTNSEIGGVAPVDAGEFLASEVADTDGDGLLEFIDAWGNPLRFYRWPTRLINSGSVDLLIKGLTADLINTDPDDPLEQLRRVINHLPNSPDAGSFEEQYHTPYTYHVPLVVSAGVDGELGMGEPNSLTLADRLGRVTDASALTDNITNRNQRSGD